MPPNPDVPMPQTFPDAYKARYMACATGLFGTMGIARDDKASRWAHMVKMTGAFGAPVIIYVIFNAELTEPYTMFDLGAITHGICLGAHALGLGTCIEAQLARYPDLVRKHLKLPTSHKIAVGIALGYPDPRGPGQRLPHRSGAVGDICPLGEITRAKGLINSRGDYMSQTQLHFLQDWAGLAPAVAGVGNGAGVGFFRHGPGAFWACLVIPKSHYENFLDLPDDLWMEMSQVSRKMARAFLEVLKAQGFNLAMNNFEAAGQIVFHAHIHVIPRYSGDGLRLIPQAKKKYQGEAMAQVGRQISEFLANL